MGAKRSETDYGVKIYLYRGYELFNHGYYEPDRCVWWEARNTLTGCVDHHATTKKHLMELIDEYGDAAT